MGEDRDEETVRIIAATLRRFGLPATNEGAAENVAQEWFDAGFEDPEEVEDWLRARCYTAVVAFALERAGITPQQAAIRTTAGTDGSEDTLGSKLASGALSFDEARRIITSEFWNS
ncbi:MAG: hypothetical protein H0T60_08680 [Acidobacteria bacterium]|nr:hypothetical protein [Acidobacteriota bacterium]